jgi:hypothetical protein
MSTTLIINNDEARYAVEVYFPSYGDNHWLYYSPLPLPTNRLYILVHFVREYYGFEDEDLELRARIKATLDEQNKRNHFYIRNL